MIKNETYYVTHGWMINELGLSGVELDVFAIIYGFSQDGVSEFKGTIRYLQEWTGKSRSTVIATLVSLVDKGLIQKRDIPVANNVKLVAYRASTDFVPPVRKSYGGCTKTVQGASENHTGGSTKIVPPYNITSKDTYIETYKDIVEYLNKKAGTSYRHTTPKTQTLIKSKLEDGYTVDDFKKVIDNKVSEWQGTEMQQYLRPETLFGNKFEGYLNAKAAPKKTKNEFHNFGQRDYDADDMMRKVMNARRENI